MAERAGISLRYLSLIEKGHRVDIRVTTAIALASALGCEPSWLVFGLGRRAAKEAA